MQTVVTTATSPEKEKKSNKKIDKNSAISHLRKLLPERIVKFIEMQIKLHGKNKKGRRYSPEIKAFALSLYHISGRAYRLVSKFFYLPSKSGLLRWVSGLPRAPRLIETAMNVIKTKVESMSETGKLCILCMDEISLKTNLMYDISWDEVMGFVDLVSGEKSNVSSNICTCSDGSRHC